MTRLQEKFTLATERANRLVKDLGSRRMVKAAANGEPGKTVRLRMHHDSSVTGHQSDGSDSDSGDDSVEAEAGQATLKAVERMRKRLLGGKLVLPWLFGGVGRWATDSGRSR